MQRLGLGGHWGLLSEETKTPFLRFSESAQSLFDHWHSALEHRLRAKSEDHAALESHFAKYRKLVPALALIFHVVECVSTTAAGRVSLEATTLAVQWCQFLEEHARRIYAIGHAAAVSNAKRLVSRILKGDLPSVFTARMVYVKGWAGLSSASEVAEPLDLLVSLDWLSELDIRKVEGGRPTIHYIVNPCVFENEPVSNHQNHQNPNNAQSKEPSKPTKGGFDGFDGCEATGSEKHSSNGSGSSGDAGQSEQVQDQREDVFVNGDLGPESLGENNWE